MRLSQSCICAPLRFIFYCRCASKAIQRNRMRNLIIYCRCASRYSSSTADGWPFQESIALHEAMKETISRSEGSWSGSSSDFISAVQKALATKTPFGDAEIDRASLKIGEKNASGSCGDLFPGEYLGEHVAVKILISEHLNDETLENEFAHEVADLDDILKNVELDALRIVFNKFQSVVSFLLTTAIVLYPEIINAIMSGRDVLVIMAVGGGKSL
ncbi:unnamed protein product [Lactuca saligna]|uniref:Protein kinase domain-containing protein n=1 Tax=Lactuca saligna TaxID=75948 RepID=A0AA36E0Q6_LACSI|nr:unnamed protein product [Lactuca saligna]